MNFDPLLKETAVQTIDTFFGNTMDKYMHFCVVIMDTGILKKVANMKQEKQ